MDYEKKYKELVGKIEKAYLFAQTDSTKAVLEEIRPELKESEDEGMVKFIKKQLFNIKKTITENYELDAKLTKAIDWLEKQGEAFTEKDVDDAYLKGISEAKQELEKQGEQKSSWSEEDEKMCQETIDWFEKKCFPYALESENPARESIKWLKSLRPQYTWKPSDEQIKALNYVVNLMASSERPTENDLYYNILKSLRQQLKKLMEE